jgi:hypothetical protein
VFPLSDLQVSLLVIGVIVVGAVTGYNWYQQWRLRRRLEQAFEDEREDVLLRGRSADAEGGPRIEPQLYGATGAEAEGAERAEPQILPAAADADTQRAQAARAAASALPAVPGFDSGIDYVAAIDSVEPMSAAGLAQLHTSAARCGRRFRVAGYSAASGAWEEAGRLSGGRYAHLRIALQLVSRRGAVDIGALTTICAAAQECAERFTGYAHCPDIQAALAHARELDRFCTEVDVAIGINVVAPPETKFAAPRIRALAKGLGLKLEPDGVFHFVDDAQRTLFTLDNHEPHPFLPEQVKHLSTAGITLLLDVPRVGDGEAALEIMLRAGRELAAGLEGTLVDDNRVPLTDQSVRAIRQQLASIHANMEASGISAGSERALRLFS